MPTRALYGLAYGDTLKLSVAHQGGTPFELGFTFARFVRANAHMDLSNLFDLLVGFAAQRPPTEAQALEFDLPFLPSHSQCTWQSVLERELGQPQAWLRRMWGVAHSKAGRVPYVDGSLELHNANDYGWIYLYDLKTSTFEIHRGGHHSSRGIGRFSESVRLDASRPENPWCFGPWKVGHLGKAELEGKPESRILEYLRALESRAESHRDREVSA